MLLQKGSPSEFHPPNLNQRILIDTDWQGEVNDQLQQCQDAIKETEKQYEQVQEFNDVVRSETKSPIPDPT